MGYCEIDDRRLMQRAENDKRRNLLQMIGARFQEDMGPSFKHASRQMSEGKPGLFFAKVGSVGFGLGMMVDGGYHMVAGNDEKVEDLFLDGQKERNYVRMFAGGCEFAAGALLAYLGAVKGPHR